jgi:hypothetical protein
LDRILAGLSACRYSIHDLSRCRGEGEENLARFNMPLELGMAMAIRAGHLRQAGHEYLILVPAELQLYQRYISDLAGLDPQTHDGTPERIVAEVLAWLLTAAEAPAEVDPQEVIDKLGASSPGWMTYSASGELDQFPGRASSSWRLAWRVRPEHV